MILLWYKGKNGKYLTLEHFPDGRIGITHENLMRHDRSGVIMTSMDFIYEVTLDRYLLRNHALNPKQGKET